MDDPALRTARHWPGLLLTALIHIALLYAMWRQLPDRPAVRPADGRPAIQWLLPLSPRPAPAQPSPRQPELRPAPAAPVTHLPTPPVPDRTADVAPARPPATPQPITPPEQAPPEPDFGPARPSAADIMSRARRDIAGIDKELRKEFAKRGIEAPPEGVQARLARGINAAHEAAGPKWYEAPVIVELSDPGSKTRVYKITTALGTYCFSQSEDGRKAVTNCPR